MADNWDVVGLASAIREELPSLRSTMNNLNNTLDEMDLGKVIEKNTTEVRNNNLLTLYRIFQEQPGFLTPNQEKELLKQVKEYIDNNLNPTTLIANQTEQKKDNREPKQKVRGWWHI